MSFERQSRLFDKKDTSPRTPVTQREEADERTGQSGSFASGGGSVAMPADSGEEGRIPSKKKKKKQHIKLGIMINIDNRNPVTKKKKTDTDKLNT